MISGSRLNFEKSWGKSGTLTAAARARLRWHQAPSCVVEALSKWIHDQGAEIRHQTAEKPQNGKGDESAGQHASYFAP